MKYLDIFLKNISQVVLINNRWTGLLILIGLFVANWQIGLAAAVGSGISILLGATFNFTKEEIRDGLAGYNSVLTAIALLLFLKPSITSMIIILVGVILTLPMSVAVKQFLTPYRVPMLTFPFVLTTWLILLMTVQFSKLNLNINILPETIQHPKIHQTHINILSGMITNFSEIFLVSSIVGSILIIIGIFIGSIKGGVIALISSCLAIMFIILLGGDYPQISDGLYGYNAILTGIALGITFKTKLNSYVAVFIGLLFTILMHGAIATGLVPFGLPILTAPFIFATWIVLFASQSNDID